MNLGNRTERKRMAPVAPRHEKMHLTQSHRHTHTYNQQEQLSFWLDNVLQCPWGFPAHQFSTHPRVRPSRMGVARSVRVRFFIPLFSFNDVGRRQGSCIFASAVARALFCTFSRLHCNLLPLPRPVACAEHGATARRMSFSHSLILRFSDR